MTQADIIAASMLLVLLLIIAVGTVVGIICVTAQCIRCCKQIWNKRG